MKRDLYILILAVGFNAFAEERVQLHSPFQRSEDSGERPVRMVQVLLEKYPAVPRGKDGQLIIVKNRVYERTHPTDPKKTVFEIPDAKGRLTDEPRNILVPGSTIPGEWLGAPAGTRWNYIKNKTGKDRWVQETDPDVLSHPDMRYFTLAYRDGDKESEVINHAYTPVKYDPRTSYRPVPTSTEER